MAEIIGTPVPPLPPPSRKNNTWLIVLVVILVLCCCLVGAIGLIIAFGPDILNELGIFVLAPTVVTLI
jgi:hypothetical protein